MNLIDQSGPIDVTDASEDDPLVKRALIRFALRVFELEQFEQQRGGQGLNRATSSDPPTRRGD